MKFDDIGKNVKLNYISLAYGNKIIPKDSFGTIAGHYYEFQIMWKVGEEFIETTLSYESIEAMEKGGILTILDTVEIPHEPKFKEDDLVQDDINVYYFIISSKFNIAKNKYEYKALDIENALKGYKDDLTDELDEDEIKLVDKCDLNLELHNEKYNVCIKKLEKI